LIFLLLFPSREKEVKLIEYNRKEVIWAICSTTVKISFNIEIAQGNPWHGQRLTTHKKKRSEFIGSFFSMRQDLFY